MTHVPDQPLRRLLREVLPPPRAASPETDLWPGLRRRIDRGLPSPTPADWILMAAVSLLCLLQPSAVVPWLIHF